LRLNASFARTDTVGVSGGIRCDQDCWGRSGCFAFNSLTRPSPTSSSWPAPSCSIRWHRLKRANAHNFMQGPEIRATTANGPRILFCAQSKFPMNTVTFFFTFPLMCVGLCLSFHVVTLAAYVSHFVLQVRTPVVRAPTHAQHVRPSCSRLVGLKTTNIISLLFLAILKLCS
jgi:hypothetical protein